jgi:glycosyltransferase involved in cell wall biosynthesis
VQYYSPWLAHLAKVVDLTVYYAHRQDGAGQAAAGFGVAFEWDVPLLEGYRWRFLNNVSKRPGLDHFGGCDTPEIVSILRNERYDALVLFGWNKKSLIQGWISACRTGTPVLVRLDSQLGAQSSPVKRTLKRLAYPFFLSRSADYLSPGARTDTYLRHYCVPQTRIHRLPHMVDTERFAAGAAASRANGTASRYRAAWGAAPADTVFIFVGKLTAIKRPHLILRGFQTAAIDNARLVFIGDGPLRAELEAQAAGDNRIRFEGFVNQSVLSAVYAAADCLVLVSNETWGLVVNEAQACGLPAIVSEEAGCVPELIEDGKTGWVLRRLDEDALAALLRAAASKPLAGAPAIAVCSARGSYDAGVDVVMKLVAKKQATARYSGGGACHQ